MKQTVKVTEVTNFFATKAEAGGFEIETTSTGIPHVKVAAKSVKPGQQIAVCLPVLKTVGEGRRVNSERVGYVAEMMEVKGLGKAYVEKGVELQNVYFD